MEEKRYYPKEPWLAVVLSSFLMGVGQIYSGRIRRGSILILTEIILGCLFVWSVLSPRCDILISVGLLLAFVTIRIWNLFDAHKCSRETNPQDFEIERKQDKDPWLALFLSDLIPGLGQLYLKKWLWGIAFTIATILVFGVGVKYRFLFYGLFAVFTAFVCFHAYVSAPVRREKSNRAILIIAIAILCWHLLSYSRYAFRAYVAEAFYIPTGAMKPALVPGDRLFVRKSKKYFPKRGDVIVFKSPGEPHIAWVMRVAALSDETIEIRQKTLYIDGQKVKWPTIEIPDYNQGKFGIEEPYKVPENCFFVLGDNTANSNDSRYFGAIPHSDFIGKAYKIYWPLRRRGPIE